jgi:hypothetical protein
MAVDRRNRITGILVTVVAVALVALVVLLHLTGTIGPGAH